MTYEVVLTKDAARDLEEFYHYIVEHDSHVSADHVLNRILQASAALKTFPDRGSCPSELRSLGISEYRQVLFTLSTANPKTARHLMGQGSGRCPD
jgi:toxin ParE1/3/4